MGAQDSLDLAKSFVQRNGTDTPTMVWDASFDSWSHYGVSGQPFVILVDAEGNELGRWSGLSSEISELIG